MLHKKSLGNPDQQKIVLLHGWGLNGKIWQPLAEKLAQQYFVEMIDLPACETEQNNWDKDVYSEKKLIPALAENITEKSIFIGWSLGGMLGLKLCQYYPGKFKKLICIATNPCFVANNEWYEGMAESEYKDFVKLFQKNPVQCLERFISLQAKGDENFKQVRRILKKQVVVKQYPVLEKGLELLETLDCRESLQQIKIPIMHILGSHDQLVPVILAHQLKKLNKLNRVEIISSAGHAPFISQLDKSYAIIDDFLAGI